MLTKNMVVLIGDYGDFPYYEIKPGVLVRYDIRNKEDKGYRKSVLLDQEEFDYLTRLYIEEKDLDKLKKLVKVVFDRNEIKQKNEDVRSKLEQKVREYIKPFPVAEFISNI